MNLRLNVKTLFCLALLLPTNAVQAQTITINQPLDYGLFVITNNSLPKIITLLPGGGYTSDPEYLFFTTPQLGNVTIDSYPPSSVVTVTLGTTNLGLSAPNFATSAAFTVPAIVTTDPTGSATFDIGATLASDGGGLTHTDGTYSGTFTVTVTP